MKSIFILLFIIPSLHYAQENTGTVEGFIIDSKSKEPIPFANVILLKEDKQMIGSTSDFDGKYTLKPVKAGKYDLQVSVGCQTQKTQGLKVRPGKTTEQNISLSESFELKPGIRYTICPSPIIRINETTTERVFKREEIQHMPF